VRNLFSLASTKKIVDTDRGAMSAGIYVFILLIMAINLTAFLLSFKTQKLPNLKIKAVENFMVQSLLENFNLFLKYSESNYLQVTRDCIDGTPFFEALVRGHKCAGIAGIPVFGSVELEGLTAGEKGIFTLMSGWSIRPNVEVVMPADQKIVEIEVPVLDSETITGAFYLRQLVSADDVAILELIISGSRISPIRRQFSIRTSDLSYQLFIRTLDSSVLTGSYIPNDPCMNEPGVKHKDPELGCATAESLAGGRGLVQYHDSFFGLHNGLGKIVGLVKGGGIQGKTIPENGILGGVKVFPPHSTDVLVNVSDIEINAQDQGRDEILIMQGFGVSAELRRMDVAAKTSETVCKIGEMGLVQQIVGLSATGGNQPLFTVGAQFSSAVADFLIKTIHGEIYLLNVKSQESASSLVPSVSEFQYHDTKLGRYYICSMKRIKNMSSDLMKVTSGSTRTNFEKGLFNVY
jgi:hypothetical protein